MVTGLCRGRFPKFGYDPESKTCLEFVYGGCEGNDNKFDDAESCMKVCSPKDPPKPEPERVIPTGKPGIVKQIFVAAFLAEGKF